MDHYTLPHAFTIEGHYYIALVLMMRTTQKCLQMFCENITFHLCWVKIKENDYQKIKIRLSFIRN